MNAVLSLPTRRPIRELPDELISQIAAGEVVERPASVVRELARQRARRRRRRGRRASCWPAASRSIVGRRRRRAASRADELPLALRRHATSKIASLAELESVGDDGLSRRGAGGDRLGRRAVASPAAPPTPHMRMRAGRALRRARARPRAASAPRVEVRELFFSTPARRKFLKTDATELAHCVEAVRRHALARPDVGFAVWHEGKLVAAVARAPTHDAAPGRRAGRRVRRRERVAGRRIDLGAAARDGPRRHARMPARTRADQQYVYVNGRFVRDKLIAHGVRSRLRGRAARPAPAGLCAVHRDRTRRGST